MTDACCVDSSALSFPTTWIIKFFCWDLNSPLTEAGGGGGEREIQGSLPVTLPISEVCVAQNRNGV